MNYYRFPNNRIFRISVFLFLFLLQMLTRSTAYANVFLDFAQSQFLMLGLILAFALVFAVYNRKHLKEILTDSRMLVLVLSTVMILGPMAVKRDWQLMYFSILLCLYTPIFLSYFLTVREAGRAYVLVSAFFAAYSLVGLFLLKPLAQAGVIQANTFYSTGGWLMYDFGLTHSVILNNLGEPALRNFGIFREPGLYQLFLFVAIQLNNYNAEWKKPWQMWAINAILMVTLLTTFATGGVIALALYLVFLFFDKGLYKNKRIVLLVVIMGAAGIAALVYALTQGGTWAYELIGMVQKFTDGSNSLVYRLDAIFINLDFFLKNPLVGGNISEVLYAAISNTSSTMIMFAVFGILGGIVHVASWVALLWKKDRPVLGNLVLMVIIFITFNTQNTTHDLFFWMFPYMAMIERGLPLLAAARQNKKV